MCPGIELHRGKEPGAEEECGVTVELNVPNGRAKSKSGQFKRLHAPLFVLDQTQPPLDSPQHALLFKVNYRVPHPQFSGQFHLCKQVVVRLAVREGELPVRRGQPLGRPFHFILHPFNPPHLCRLKNLLESLYYLVPQFVHFEFSP